MKRVPQLQVSSFEFLFRWWLFLLINSFKTWFQYFSRESPLICDNSRRNILMKREFYRTHLVRLFIVSFKSSRLCEPVDAVDLKAEVCWNWSEYLSPEKWERGCFFFMLLLPNPIVGGGRGSEYFLWKPIIERTVIFWQLYWDDIGWNWEKNEKSQKSGKMQ